MVARFDYRFLQRCAHCQFDGQSWYAGKAHSQDSHGLTADLPSGVHDVGVGRDYCASVFLFDIGED